MDALFGEALPLGTLVLLLLSLAVAFGFEFVNGFHDTANAVATVIYTKSLRPWTAVVWSGICNFCGVFFGGIAVAMGIVYLLPVELLISKSTGAGLAMVLALLLGAIIWNLGTWYFGLPASSSHTLIGAIVGVGLANSMLPGHRLGDGVNWGKVSETGLSLLLSPLIGFLLAAILVLLSKNLLPDKRLYEKPDEHNPPPLWIRAILVLTCTGVSFAHGSNDGQKGIGLVMLILTGIVPASFALDMSASPQQIETARQALVRLEGAAVRLAPAEGDALRAAVARVRGMLDGHGALNDIPREQRKDVRADIIKLDAVVKKVLKAEPSPFSAAEADALKKDAATLKALTDFAPLWVKIAIALSLGIGTMVGWQRIVVTIGEKIGKEHLTYGQGASAELVAMSSIGMASYLGLPVSTTHVLSSGVAGTMVAKGSGLQLATVIKIASAWVLTLPAAIFLSGGFFLLFNWLFV
ncbi:MAG: inorganic phosphate transporter [Chloracidobacterium sp.]|nr:inorganic phosphate transporter [Chloracidobacterium sp.]MDW8216330.1 inorganic phosphate transporter [Acidobacteriota bacterium]